MRLTKEEARRREHNKANRDRRAWLKDHGFCIVCGCTYNEPGYALCKGCIKRREVHDKKYDPTGERRRQNNQRRREERIAAGLCTECGKPVDILGHVCLRCKEMRRDCVRGYKLKKRIERQTEETRRRLDAKNV